MRFTDYAKDGVLSHYFGGGGWSNAGVTGMEVALFSSDPTSAGLFTDEITGLGRQSVTFGAANQHVITNTNTVTFSTSGWSASGVVATHLAVINNHSSAPKILSYGMLTNSITISASEDIEIDIDGLAIGFDTNSITQPVTEDYAFPDSVADEVLEFVFRPSVATIPAQPTAWELSLHTAVSLDGTQYEWTGPNYSRQAFASGWNSVASASGGFREVTNNGAITFVNQTESPVAMWGVWDSGNNKLLTVNDLVNDLTVISGSSVVFSDQSISLSID